MMTEKERAQAVEQLTMLADRVARERRMCSDCESWDHCERDGCALLHKVALSIATKPALSGTHGEWRVYEADTPQCSHCGMWMPFARYRRKAGANARRITDFCPSCGEKMTAMPMCGDCKYGQGVWKEDGICYACREQVWIPGAPHRKAGEED
nr:MAG TPA: Thaumarchaeal output domain 1 [Caudoviricetes sp.]